MYPRTILPLAFAATFASLANAQPDDSIASTSFEYYPSAGDDSRPGETLQLNVFRASVGVPFQVAKRTTLIAGAGYELLDVHRSGEDSFQLHAPTVTFGAIQGIGERWAVWGIADLGFASDFSESIGSDDVLASLTGIVSYELSKSFTLGAGAVYDRRTGTLAPLPAVLLNLRLGERARVRGFVPSYLAGEYRITNWIDAGVRATFEGNRFHLGEEKFGAENLELAYSTLTVGPKVTLSATDWVHFEVYGAGAVHRRYEVFQDDESISRYGLDPVMAYGVRFRFGPSGWEQEQGQAR